MAPGGELLSRVRRLDVVATRANMAKASDARTKKDATVAAKSSRGGASKGGSAAKRRAAVPAGGKAGTKHKSRQSHLFHVSAIGHLVRAVQIQNCALFVSRAQV